MNPSCYSLMLIVYFKAFNHQKDAFLFFNKQKTYIFIHDVYIYESI